MNETTPERKLGFRPDIEGLRAIAVLLVVFFHSGVPFLGGGYVGVDVFFVISGFLITGILLRELATTGHISFARFYLRRARRLFPALTIVLVATLILTTVFQPTLTSVVATDAVWSSFYLVNFHFLARELDYFNADLPDSPLQHIWSLSIEEQFYLVIPALLLVLFLVRYKSQGRASLPAPIRARFPQVFAGLFIASYGLSILMTPEHPATAYFLPFSRAWELLAGSLLAIATARRPDVLSLSYRAPSSTRATLLAGLGLVLVLVSGVTFTDDQSFGFPGWIAIVPVAGTVLMLASAPSAPLVLRFLSLAPMQWMGKISYSLYLWHWPLLALFAHAGTRYLDAWMSVAMVLASIIAATITYVVIEDPIRHRRSLIHRRGIGFAFAAATIAVTCGTAASAVALRSTPTSAAATAKTSWSIAGDKHPARSLAQIVRASVKVKRLPKYVVINPRNPIVNAWFSEQGEREKNCAALDAALARATYTCALSSADRKVIEADPTLKVAVFGDSLAGRLVPALQELSAKRKWSLILGSKKSCPTFFDWISHQEGLDGEGCRTSRKAFLQRLGKEQVDVVILHNAAAYCAQIDCVTAFADAVDRIRVVVPNATITYMHPTPLFRDYIATCLTANPHRIDRCSGAVKSYYQSRYPETEMDAEGQRIGVHMIHPKKWLCTKTTCPAVIGDIVATFDNGHISSLLSFKLAPLIEDEIDAALASTSS